VRQVAYTYAAGKFTLGAISTITTVLGADGIVTTPDGSLIVGGEGTTWKVNPKTGTFQKTNPGGNVISDHVTYDSQSNVIWTSGDNPVTTLAKISLTSFANSTSGTPVQLKGDDTVVSAVAFDGSHNAYYTSSSIQGNGSFGTINFTTLTTTRKINHLPAAHGIIYDPFTNTLLLAGANHITQIDPKTLSVLSDWTVPAQYPGLQLDQDTTDGLGHMWVASNDGNLVFLDFSQTRKVADPTNAVSIQHLDTNLDDMTLECLNE
jgi:streptogramin lyase